MFWFLWTEYFCCFIGIERLIDTLTLYPQVPETPGHPINPNTVRNPRNTDRTPKTDKTKKGDIQKNRTTQSLSRSPKKNPRCPRHHRKNKDDSSLHATTKRPKTPSLSPRRKCGKTKERQGRLGFFFDTGGGQGAGSKFI